MSKLKAFFNNQIYRKNIFWFIILPFLLELVIEMLNRGSVIGGFKSDEIGDIYGMPPATVRSRQKRALEKLREIFIFQGIFGGSVFIQYNIQNC